MRIKGQIFETQFHTPKRMYDVHIGIEELILIRELAENLFNSLPRNVLELSQTRNRARHIVQEIKGLEAKIKKEKNEQS